MPSAKDAPFFCLLFFGRQRKVGAAPHRGDARRKTRKQVQRERPNNRIKTESERQRQTHNNQRITRRKSARIAPRYALKRAASAPSITRWSYDSDSGSVSLGTNCLPSHTGFIAPRDRPRIATSGALMIGVKFVPPIPPSDEIEKQPPCI